MFNNIIKKYALLPAKALSIVNCQLSILMLLLPLCLSAQAPKGTVLIQNVTAHVGNGTVVDNAVIGIKDGKFMFVNPAAGFKPDLASFEMIVDGKGQHAYPGFIAPNTALGLQEVESVRATNDYSEVGEFNPNVRSIIAYNTDSEVLPTIRSGGVLMVQVVPQGGIISGTSSVVTLESGLKNWEDVAYAMDEGMWINFPDRFNYSGWWAEPGPTKRSEKYQEALNELRDYFEQAKSYLSLPQRAEKNLRFEAMRNVLAGKTNLYIRVDDAQTILEAAQFAKEFGCKPVMVGASGSWRVAKFLAEQKIPVMLERVHSLPKADDDDVSQPFKTAKMLHDAGVKFCFLESDYWQNRNIMYQAGHAVGYGLPREAAVRALTLDAAEIMGIGATCGSLEAGKDATLILSVGDALDIRTSFVTQAFIKGKPQDMDDKQKKLYRDYKTKYGF